MKLTSSAICAPGLLTRSTVAAFRRTFGHWLDQHLELDEERVADIVLATDEAMSNCVDHAYRVVDYAGSITLHVSYYPVTSELKIRVIDHGHWMEPETVANNARGRGILLMRALADDCTIDGGAGRHYGLPPVLRLPAQQLRHKSSLLICRFRHLSSAFQPWPMWLNHLRSSQRPSNVGFPKCLRSSG